MSFVKFYPYNLVTQDGTTVTASATNALFPETNLQDYRSTKCWRSQTGTLTDSIVFDFVTAQPVDTVMIKGNAVTGLLGFDVFPMIIEANPIDAWGAPAFSTTLTPDVDFNFGYATFPAESYRFWRVTVSNSVDFAELCNIFIGESVTLAPTQNWDFGWQYLEKDLSKVTVNRYGQRFIDKIVRQRELKGDLKLLNPDELDIVLDMYDSNGTTEPIWITVDDIDVPVISNDPERYAGCFYFDKMPSVSNSAFRLFNLKMSLIEAT